jgi:hypothetical protein
MDTLSPMCDFRPFQERTKKFQKSVKLYITQFGVSEKIMCKILFCTEEQRQQSISGDGFLPHRILPGVVSN